MTREESIRVLRDIAAENGGALAGPELQELFNLAESAPTLDAREVVDALCEADTERDAYAGLWDATFAAAFVREAARFEHHELDRPAVREVLSARCAALASLAVECERERAVALAERGAQERGDR